MQTHDDAEDEIVPVEGLPQVLHLGVLLEGAPIVARVDELKVEVPCGTSGPELRRVQEVGLVADDEGVVRHADHERRVDPVDVEC
ncbi:MAG TPA: hypothetical protein VF331_19990 [Polyangiales bacterium]